MEKFHSLETLYQLGNDREIVDQYITQIHQIESYPIPFQELHAAVVLGAPVAPYIQPNGEITYEFPDIMEERAGEGDILTAGEWRAKAAAKTSLMRNHTIPFLVTGGVQRFNVDNQIVSVSKAEQMGKKMREFGVPGENIVIIGSEGRGNTRGNFLDIRDYLIQNGFADCQSLELGLITSLFQLPRTLSIPEYFAEDLAWFHTHNTGFHPIPSERLLFDEADYVVRMKRALQHAAAIKRAKMEVQGISDMQRGSYTIKLS